MLSFFRIGSLGFAGLALIDLWRLFQRPGQSLADLFLRVPYAGDWGPVCLAALAAVLVTSAHLRISNEKIRRLMLMSLGFFAIVSIANIVSFYLWINAGLITTKWPIPSSFLMLGYLVAHGYFVLIRKKNENDAPESVPWSTKTRLSGLKLAALHSGLFILFTGVSIAFHLHAFGLTDYRRPADAILVLGAKVYANGALSEALRERVETGVELYKQGLAPKIIMTGGIDPQNGQSEPLAMKKWAMQGGVPEEAILIDEAGNNTIASIENTRLLMETTEIKKVLAVSHYHHLTRIKLLATKAHVPCYTVPADEGETLLRRTPLYVIRETAAVAYYYLMA